MKFTLRTVNTFKIFNQKKTCKLLFTGFFKKLNKLIYYPNNCKYLLRFSNIIQPNIAAIITATGRVLVSTNR